MYPDASSLQTPDRMVMGNPDPGSQYQNPAPAAGQMQNIPIDPPTQTQTSQLGAPTPLAPKKVLGLFELVKPTEPEGMTEESMNHGLFNTINIYVYFAAKMFFFAFTVIAFSNVIAVWTYIILIPCIMIACLSVDLTAILSLITPILRRAELFWLTGISCGTFFVAGLGLAAGAGFYMLLCRIIVMIVYPRSAVYQGLMIVVDMFFWTACSFLACCVGGSIIVSFTNWSRMTRQIKEKRLKDQMQGTVAPPGAFQYAKNTQLPQFEEDSYFDQI